MALSHREARERLSTIESEDPHEVRRLGLEVLLEVAEADVGLFFTYVLVDGVPHYGRMCVAGGRCAHALLENEGQPAVARPLWDPSVPRAGERQTFVAMQDSPLSTREIRSSSAYERLFAPLGVHDLARALLYEQGQFVGWLGALRCLERRFVTEDITRLNRLVEAFATVFVAADELEREQLTAPGQLLLDPETGEVQCASRTVQSWLDERRREHLRCAVRRFAPRRSLSASIIVDGWAVRLCRLDGSADHFILASITGLEVPRLSAKAALTPRQREILDYLVEGMTHGEIAEALGLSPYTVNDHVRAI